MIWLWVGIAAVVVVAAAVVPMLGGGRRARLRGNDEAMAARSSYTMLGHYAESPAATDDEEAAALLRSARERWNTAGSVLASAATEEDFRLAEQIAREGLEAVSAAHARLGLPTPEAPE
jgi:hypothetical protein